VRHEGQKELATGRVRVQVFRVRVAMVWAFHGLRL
jgi:hypothetical protein